MMAIGASQAKGALLEYLVRRLLFKCGFIPVVADNMYTYRRGNLFFVNGRGAAHDADVFMEPPIQMPFIYPTRVIFECKAYSSRAGLPIVRNALGLREDINEFEIVTKESLEKRRNNRRADYAVEKRDRYNYQVGVAGVGGFTRSAVEFATNNKIPLLSLEWFLGPNIIRQFSRIDNSYLSAFDENQKRRIFNFLKSEYKPEASQTRHENDIEYPRDIIGDIIQSFTEIENSLFVGLLESGEIIFLRALNEESIYFFEDIQTIPRLTAKIHYSRRSPFLWELSVSSGTKTTGLFEFFVPPGIMRVWQEFNLSREKAVDLKASYFSRIFVFNRYRNSDWPVFVIRLDREWLDEVIAAERDWGWRA